MNATTNIAALVTDLRNLGHGLLFPPNVKGWDGGRTWINSSTLLGRANLVGRILYSDRTKFAGGTLHDLLNGLRIRGAEDRVDWLAGQMLATNLPPTVYQQLVEVTGRNGGGEESLKEAIQLISTLPEFHLN